MSVAFWRRLSIFAGLIAVAAIFGLMVFVANIEIKDLDLWLHIGMGRHIVQNDFLVPQVDILSHTIAGKPWINHEWLFQVIVYEVHTLWGAAGLIQMQIILVVLTTLILLLMGYNSQKQLASIVMLLLVTIVYQGRFTNRPDLFSLLFFAAYIYILSFYISQRWSVYALFIIQILWSNMHGFFFFGPLFVLIGLVSEWLRRHVRLPYEWNRTGRLTDEEYRRGKMILVLVIMACFLNPCTIRGAWYPVKVFFQISGESKVFFESIMELERPIALNNIFDINRAPYYKILIILSAMSIFFNRRKLDISTLIFWVVFLVFSLAAIRNLIFFAFAAYLVFVTNAMTLSMQDLLPFRIKDMRFVHIVSIFVKVAIFLWIYQYGMERTLNGYYDQYTFEWKSEFGGISQKSFPVKAVDFLVENKVSGNFLNGFNTGAYLVGRCFPDIKVFIDGRTEVYGPKFFKYYRDLWGIPTEELLDQALKRFAITGVFLHSHKYPPSTKLLKAVDGRKDFVPVYFDYDGIIYLKDIPRQRELIDKFRIDFNQWDPFRLDLLEAGYKRIPPERNITRGEVLARLGYDQAALAEAQQAMRIDPTYATPYKIKGKILADRGEYAEAFEVLRTATMLDPRDHKIRLMFADMFVKMDRRDLALEHYQKILDKWPNYQTAYYRMAELLIEDKKIGPAVRTLRQAQENGSWQVDEIIKLVDLLIEAEAWEAARFILNEIPGKTDKPEVQSRIERVTQVLTSQNAERE